MAASSTSTAAQSVNKQPARDPAMRGTLIGHTVRRPRRPVYHGGLILQNLMLVRGIGYREAVVAMRRVARSTKFIVIE